jgi:uncharacterized membrane protein YgcG
MKRSIGGRSGRASTPWRFIATVGGLVLAVTFVDASVDATRARADTVVQFPIDALLNARPVSTLTNGAVVTWTPTQGVDGNGSADGYITKAVLTKLGQMGNALPDDGVFPAANGIPEIDLHFANNNTATSFQAVNAHRAVAATIDFAVPQATYSKIFLVLTSAEGADKLTVTLTYADATTSMIGPFTLTDYDTPIPANTADVGYFSLISMHKWSQANQLGDNAGHQITGVILTPAPTKLLKGVTIAKPADGQYLVFWGATGIATSAVDGGVPVSGGDAGADDAGADSMIAGMTDGGAAGGSSGGASGSGGSNAGSGGGSGGAMTGSGGSPGGEGNVDNRTISHGCALSASTGTDASFRGIMLALFAAFVARRASRVRPRR